MIQWQSFGIAKKNNQSFQKHRCELTYPYKVDVGGSIPSTPTILAYCFYWVFSPNRERRPGFLIHKIFTCFPTLARSFPKRLAEFWHCFPAISGHFLQKSILFSLFFSPKRNISYG